MTSPSPETVDSVQDLMNLADLEQIVFHQVSGKRVSEAELDQESREASHDLSVKFGHSDNYLSVRCLVTFRAPDAQYEVDAEAVYAFQKPLSISMETAKEFVERVGLMALYPFLRESVHSLSSKLGTGQALMGLLRANGIDLVEEPVQS